MTNTPAPELVDLLPCPFCGGDANLNDIVGTTDIAVFCIRDRRCGSIVADDRATAIAAWNTRPAIPPTPEISEDEAIDLTTLERHLSEGNFYQDYDESLRLLGVFRKHLRALQQSTRAPDRDGVLEEAARMAEEVIYARSKHHYLGKQGPDTKDQIAKHRYAEWACDVLSNMVPDAIRALKGKSTPAEQASDKLEDTGRLASPPGCQASPSAALSGASSQSGIPSAEEVDAAIAKLSDNDKDLIAGRCSGWGSWMWGSGSYMVSIGLGTKRGGNIDFDTPLAEAVIAKLRGTTTTLRRAASGIEAGTDATAQTGAAEGESPAPKGGAPQAPSTTPEPAPEEEVERLRELLAKATPGPWQVEGSIYEDMEAALSDGENIVAHVYKYHDAVLLAELFAVATAINAGRASTASETMREALVPSDFIAEGVARERAAIIKWLRDQCDKGAEIGAAKEKGSTGRAAYAGGSYALKLAADAIERGDHR